MEAYQAKHCHRYAVYLGCQGDLTNTSEYYARYTTSAICSGLVQSSATDCDLSSEQTRPLCAEDCVRHPSDLISVKFLTLRNRHQWLRARRRLQLTMSFAQIDEATISTRSAQISPCALGPMVPSTHRASEARTMNPTNAATDRIFSDFAAFAHLAPPTPRIPVV